MAETTPFRFHDLPIEIQIRVLGFLEYPTLQDFLLTSRQAVTVFDQHYPSLVAFVFDRYPNVPRNAEIRHLLYRVIQLSNLPTRPYERGPLIWVQWLQRFRSRNELALPRIRHSVKTLVLLNNIVDSVNFWLARFRTSLSRVYETKSLESLPDQLASSHISGHSGQHRFSKVEVYRISRSLCLFQLYCALFYQWQGHPDATFNGRVSEQVSFLQALQPFIVAELDGVYGMIEWEIASHYGFRWTLSRRSSPMRPGVLARPGGARLEFLMSIGLQYLKVLLDTEAETDEFEPRHEAYETALRQAPASYNRFLPSALSRCWVFRTDSSGQNQEVLSYPPLVPVHMDRWKDAPEGTNEGSWAYRAYGNELGTEYRSTVRGVAAADIYNWRGTVFWDRDRVEWHRCLVVADDVGSRFGGSETDASAARLNDARVVDRWTNFDPPNIGYQPRIRPLSTSTTSPLSMLTGVRHRVRLYGQSRMSEVRIN